MEGGQGPFVVYPHIASFFGLLVQFFQEVIWSVENINYRSVWWDITGKKDFPNCQRSRKSRAEHAENGFFKNRVHSLQKEWVLI